MQKSKSNQAKVKFINFVIRSITAGLLMAFTLLLLKYFASYLWLVLLTLVFILVTEITIIVFNSNKSNVIKLCHLFLLSCYVVLSIKGLYQLYLFSLGIFLSTVIVVWSTDIGAYLVGITIGKRKLFPNISPNKTLAGFIGGIIISIMTAAFLSHYLYGYIVWTFIGIMLSISIISQIGDLLESAIKRYYKIKNSGSILPGHGGFFDRLDSLLLVGAATAWIFYQWGFAVLFYKP